MKKTFLRAVALTAAISFGIANMSFAAGGSVGYGKINVYKNEKLMTKLSGQNPIEDQSVLICDGKCMIKSEGISLIAADKSEIAIKNETDTFALFIREGTVDFIINNNNRKLVFYTPAGAYTASDIIFNASGTPSVKGFVSVDETGTTEIGLTEGRMIFATADGMKPINANEKIVLAVTPSTTSTSWGWWQWVAAGGLTAAAAWGVYELVDDDDDDDNGQIAGGGQGSGGGVQDGTDDVVVTPTPPRPASPPN